MVMVAPFFVICRLLVSASGQQSLTDSAIHKFTTLLMETTVRNFIDSMIDKTRSLASSSLASFRIPDETTQSRGNDYPFCGSCERAHTLSVAKTTIEYIREECSRSGPTRRVEDFCTYLEMDLDPVFQFLYGYVFDRSRAYELAIAICIEYGRCPARSFFKDFHRLSIYNRLFDLTSVFYCTYRPNATFSDCSENLLASSIRFAAKAADDICYATYPKGLFEEFCYYHAENAVREECDEEHIVS
ncbi:hypothetical protein FOL47_002581 [Perkinsus chesapeaki]|uniref:Uncharacterized protein n=1 Tax=Perkinsus chesapeaki TaxID=330153 RepID=A0A7J6MCR6_PERCH|nr:hypothetical protein FOL47_002581 [Perkinsus chesapeaki]